MTHSNSPLLFLDHPSVGLMDSHSDCVLRWWDERWKRSHPWNERYLKLWGWVAIASICLPQWHMEQSSQRVSVKYSFDLGIDAGLICVWRITFIFITANNNSIRFEHFSWAKHLVNHSTIMMSLNSFHWKESILLASQLLKIWEAKRLLWGSCGSMYIWDSSLGLILGPEFPMGLCHMK